MTNAIYKMYIVHKLLDLYLININCKMFYKNVIFQNKI